MSAPKKTTAARVLDGLGVRYELKPYEVDESDLSAPTVAAKVGLPCEQVFKTLCVRGEKTGVHFAVIAADQDLDLKALAKAVGDKKMTLVSLKEVQPLTGYVRGGVTVFGAKRDYPVVVDSTMRAHEVVSVSAGQRGLQIFVSPLEYLRASKALEAPIGRPAAGAAGDDHG
jgi:Cys-tRNA(Pro)/Cys-tRNA(Cys) deacylase